MKWQFLMAEEARRKDSLFGELMKTAGWVVMCQPGPNGGGHSEGMGGSVNEKPQSQRTSQRDREHFGLRPRREGV